MRVIAVVAALVAVLGGRMFVESDFVNPCPVGQLVAVHGPLFVCAVSGSIASR